jgi:adenylate cyclase
MIAGEASILAQTRAKQRRFGLYVLDLDRGCLLLGEDEIALRPKTFAVLCHLVENAGRLVSKDELFAAVWPNVVVTDDALVQSIGELRRAIGDDAQRLIRTIPRRGYRFEPDVSDVPAGGRHSVEAVSVLEAAPVVDRRAPPAATTLGWRFGLAAACALMVALAFGALWLGLPRPADRPTVAGSPPGSDIGARPAIAILPFLNQSESAAREYFADGLTQDLIHALGRFSELTVMSWNAVSAFKGKPESPGAIARKLAVRYQVEGSIRQSGDRIRVIAQLVDTDGRVLWSGSFEEAFSDLFALQDRITTQIAGALAVRVTQSEQRRAFARPTENLEAYDFVLRARPALQRPARADNVEARALLRRATLLDPNYAAAYAALAETYHIDMSMGWAQSPRVALARAEELANKALSINDTEQRARVVLGRVHIFHQRYEQAMVEIDRAIAINPSDANGLAGRGNILMWLGQTDAAIETLELAQRIDPELNAIDRFALSLAYYLRQRYGAAIEQAELNLRRTEGAHFSRVVLAAAYAQLKRDEDAARVVATIRRLDPAFDSQEFGTKFLNSVDLERLRDGLRKAGLARSGN